MAVRRYLERWQFWREVIRRQEASGLSVAAFCRQEQVAPASFFAWRKKLAEADRQDEHAMLGHQAKPASGQNASHAVSGHHANSASGQNASHAVPERGANAAQNRSTNAAQGRGTNAAHAQFVPIELVSWPKPAASFEIVDPDGYRVVVPAVFDAESLREILCVLKEVASC